MIDAAAWLLVYKHGDRTVLSLKVPEGRMLWLERYVYAGLNRFSK
jgi:hypothetical protein